MEVNAAVHRTRGHQRSWLAMLRSSQKVAHQVPDGLLAHSGTTRQQGGKAARQADGPQQGAVTFRARRPDPDKI
ncbi:hypothetical protein NDU88_003656 [Pleurodeles waltl]|uniref:Uncharacterized protein n=1 Tax=Pleurodeles waltl TaxID=8319 RepID=A0AAV7W5Y1_PLEWA|nr:hypothetical protein NDU88_003656 [Pleurodeles waltl]